MRAILVGAGGVSRQLLRRLGERWVITVVDVSSERLTEAEGLRPFRSLVGDGSSRLVLKRAGLEQADAVVAAAGDDEVNLEVCRLARESNIRRLVAVAADPERLDDYRELGVTTISPDGLAARRVELNLETRRVSSVAFADGQAEAIEFRIASDSPVRGKVLSDLHAHSWIVGAVLRGNELIIPHGTTEFRTGDLVTVVGAGADFAEIVRTFTSGEGRFPLDFGKRVAVALERDRDVDGPVAEAVQMVRSSRASSVLVVHRDPDAIREDDRADELRAHIARAESLAQGVDLRGRTVDGSPSRALASIPGVESVGVIVLPAGPQGLRQTRAATRLVRATGRPVLLSRGSHPYRRILVPARRTAAGRAAIRAAIDLARFAKADLHGVAVVDPIFISGPGAPSEAERAIGWLEEEAAVHGVGVTGTIQRGNPVRALVELSGENDLLVMGYSPRERRLSIKQGMGQFVARRSARSVLLVPA